MDDDELALDSLVLLFELLDECTDEDDTDALDDSAGGNRSITSTFAVDG